MAVVGYAQPIWNGRRSKLDEKGMREYSVPYRVKTDDAHDGGGLILLAPGLPAMYSGYVEPTGFYDTYVRLTSLEPRQEADDPCRWTVTANYTRPNFDPAKSAENPTSRPAEIRFSTSKTRYVLIQDYSDPPKPVLNSAGQRFDPPLEVDRSLVTVNISRNEPGWDVSLALIYVNTVNAVACFGQDPGHVKMDDISAEVQWDYVVEGIIVPYWRVSYTLVIDPLGWDLRPVDIGTKSYNLAVPPKLDFNYEKGIVDPTPRLLGGNGYLLAEADYGSPVYLQFKGYPAVDYTNLSLPGA